ncbi:Lacal_2735 family protein [Pontimicrobium aquaticum]|uniref:Lacal_2735 family protein n=1 Tax=Pontimicrobium aquaticum TaxID=2565367 RepID=A0A4U0EVH2_9FLAO|nr:Lacal_2735 family protein [Pontimicrobium aquaticum]TJY35843.1 Lacal_2735 family protein [Pontimicrobium aquaticum]
MFGLFRSKSKLDTLQKQYEKLMSEWHKLSSIDRAKSDEKYAEAQKILDQIDVLKQK